MKRLTAILLSYLVLLSITAAAQERKLQYRPYIDQRKFHYGFFVGVHMQDMELRNNGFIDPETQEQWYADVDNYSPGFSVGVLGELRLNNYMALRITPTMHFGQKHVSFHEQVSGRDTTQNMKSVYISIPIDMKFSAPRFNNYRPYFLAGVAPSVDLTTKKQKALLTKPFDCYLEVGMGCDIYLPFFKLIPELKFCFGLANILQKNRPDLVDRNLLKFSKSLDGSSAKMIVLTFYFE